MKVLAQKGYTLFELLLSISLVGIIAAFSIPVTKTYLDQNELDVAFRVIASSIRKASTYASTGYYDSQWGYRLQSNQVIVYSGTSYAARTANRDQIFAYSDKVAVSGLTEVNFAKLTSAPSTTGSINISNTFGSKTVNINSKGFVIY